MSRAAALRSEHGAVSAQLKSAKRKARLARAQVRAAAAALDQIEAELAALGIRLVRD